MSDRHQSLHASEVDATITGTVTVDEIIGRLAESKPLGSQLEGKAAAEFDGGRELARTSANCSDGIPTASKIASCIDGGKCACSNRMAVC